ncbi:hypothetical protein PAMP_022300 [Pampus punctatissimus]
MRKRRLCVKIIPRAAAETAVYDIQITAKSNEINNMGVWYRIGDVHQHQSSKERSSTANSDSDAPSNTVRRQRQVDSLTVVTGVLYCADKEEEM